MNPVEFEIMYRRLIAIAEQMGVLLMRSSYSPNIRERMDASCAIFSGEKELIAQAEHIPVHLGSMHMPLQYMDMNLVEGDQIIVNDPSMGGTHLPDLTIYKPVFLNGKIIGFVGNRAHHADIGGITPGSMPGDSRDIYQEGLIIPPVKIVDGGKVKKDVVNIILANTRTPWERRGDLMSQIGANNYGSQSLKEFVKNYGYEKYLELILELKNYTRRIVERRIENLPRGDYTGEDYVEVDGSPARIRVRVNVGKKIEVDFSGTSSAMRSNINASLAVTHSSVYFFFRTFLGSDVPINSEFYRFFDIRVPKNSILNPPRGYPMVAGNVETSQRIVDSLILALSRGFDMPAQSHGTMNNVSFGNERFTYYETIGGGAGAFKNYPGEDGIHVYMTNTKNTPVEVIESSYPLLCVEYRIRTKSGGRGRWKGGDGIIKHYRSLEDCVFSILSDRRKIAPRGINGGKDGKRGINILIRGGRRKIIGSKVSIDLKRGDEIVIMTPGGGGYGEE